jgi:uncharacterized membrane protein YebE (DUF533 family)
MSQEITTVRSFLDRLLSEGRSLAVRAEDAAAQRLGLGDDPDSRSRLRSTAAGVGVAAGVLGLLMGTRRGRRALRTGAAAGGLALLGKLAFDAWNRSGRGSEPGTPLAELPEEEADVRAETLAWAMIAAAKADGHVDEAEHAAIEAALRDLPLPVRASLTTALLRPVDAEAIAARATSDQERREIYAASVLITGRDHPDEIAYLDRLARALGLSADEVAAIEAGAEAEAGARG